jgi:hypothetical protein
MAVNGDYIPFTARERSIREEALKLLAKKRLSLAQDKAAGDNIV